MGGCVYVSASTFLCFKNIKPWLIPAQDVAVGLSFAQRLIRALSCGLIYVGSYAFYQIINLLGVADWQKMWTDWNQREEEG